jgi:phosphatidylserine/phosphatidylglycerophosphate/cardiolipin synthase-like enzyme/uncharacterized membrane protein YdjX (TVP38/TMEM64 family)
MESSPWLVCGRNCWRIEQTEKAAFLIDGEAYFQAFRDAALQAKYRIMIVGWDLDTQIELVKGDVPSEFPRKLGEFLVALLRRKRKLKVFVLNWDFAMIYALEREWMPTAEQGWSGHRRLSYQIDGQHPLGASHHQKLVVIDDTVAFVGGLDLTKSRWDTPAHLLEEPRRVDPDGKPYLPFHDVQMMVSGDAAAALGDLARARWRNATGRGLPQAVRRPVEELWPVNSPPDVEQCAVGISRTQPAYDGQAEIREIEQAYLDGIKAARRFIYIESQYFTANVIGRALATRLSEPEGPEVVLVLRHNCDGWLERQTMDSLRARILNELELADHYGRLRIYAPTVPGTNGEVKVGVHSKLLVVDDDFAFVGSANVSNRSMGFDTECNLAIESQGQPHLRAVIASLRNRLLAEHLGVEVGLVAEKIQELDTVIGAIEALRGGERSLEDGCFDNDRAAADLIPEHLLIDPERPMVAEQVLDSIANQSERDHVGRRMVVALSLLAAMGLLAAAWRWTPLGEQIRASGVLDALQTLGRGSMGFIVLLGCYILGGFLVVPVVLLIVVTVVALGPWLGAPSAMAGSLLSALILFGLGRTLGRYRVRRFIGHRAAHLSRRLAERGLWGIFMVRILPIAPFSMVNLVAGVTPVSLRDFMLGTVLGMAPGILVTSLFVEHLERAVRDPSPLAFGLLGMLIAGAWVLVWYLSRRMRTGRQAALAVSGDRSATVT